MGDFAGGVAVAALVAGRLLER
jgi:hypothetical protein